MSLDDHLSSVCLLDCTGQITHTLTLDVDGSVRVKVGQFQARIDPATRLVSPPTVRLGRGEYGHAQVVEMACSLAAGR